MSEKILLNATSAYYEKYFPGARLSPPEALRVSSHGEAVQMLHMPGADIQDEEARWGFIPAWRMTAGEPSYYAAGASISREWTRSVAFRNWRCIIPATSFVVLRKIDGETMRYELTRTGGGLMLLGGIFEPNPHPAGGSAPTVALITTTPNRMLAPHGLQVPLLLNQKQVMPWLRGRTNIDVVKGFIRPPGESTLTLTITTGQGEIVERPVQADLELV